jgi:2-oxoglutarate ferredoxin oxidoreductase subunit alpha
MPTRTQQADLLSAAYASHGDTKHVLLFPRDPRECFELSVRAFDLADRLQTPVIVMSDLDIGMNDWMCADLDWDQSYAPDRGKVLTAEQLEKGKFFRYLDVDGDGIPQRTLPGVHPRGAYFVRGSGHNQYGGYTEDAAEYQQVVDRLAKKWQTAASLVPEPEIRRSRKGSSLGLVSVGSCDGTIREALDRLAERGIYSDYCRIRAFPFGKKVRQFLEQHEQVFVIEQNRDAQLRTLLLAETQCPGTRLKSILHYGGLPMDWRCIVAALEQQAAQGAAA